jgi:hypothetical protein
MGKQTFNRIKKTIVVLIAVFFVVSLTAASASAQRGGFERGHGGGFERGHGGGFERGHGGDFDRGFRHGFGGCGWWNNWCGQCGWWNNWCGQCGWWNNWCRW